MKADQEFEALRRLLKLKRYETPPPRYFNNFSGSVVARIKNGTRAENLDSPEREMSWWQRLLSGFQAKPAVAGGFGVAVCALLGFGVLVVQQTEVQAPNSLGFAATGGSESETILPNPAFAGAVNVSATPGVVPAVASFASPATPTNSIFDMFKPVAVPQTINWTQR